MFKQDVLSEEEENTEEFLAIRQSIHLSNNNNSSPLRREGKDGDVPPMVVGRRASPRSVLHLGDVSSHHSPSSPPPLSPTSSRRRTATTPTTQSSSRPSRAYADDLTAVEEPGIAEGISRSFSSVTLSHPLSTNKKCKPTVLSACSQPVTPHRDGSPAMSTPSSHSALSDVSLSATDVKILVSALKRAVGPEFQAIIQSIKDRKQPQQSSERTAASPMSSPSALSRKSKGQSTTSSRKKHRQPVVETVESDSERQADLDDILGEDELSTRSPSAAIAPEKMTREMENAETDHNDRVNSILEEIGSDSSFSANEGRDLDFNFGQFDDHSVVSSDEGECAAPEIAIADVQLKCAQEKDEFVLKVQQRSQQQCQSTKSSRMFCVSGTQIDEATELLSKLYTGSVETAKVRVQCVCHPCV